MSGTSVDGLDLALCEFTRGKNKWNYKIIDTVTYPYSNRFKKELRNAEHLTAVDLHLLSNKLAKYFSDKISLFLKGKVKPDIICSHGHTIYHQPKKQFTLQIGNGAIIAANTGIKTICDFRTLDVANGGQGAPLVPIGDKLLFSDYNFCVNIGGFANVSCIKNKEYIAYDICGVNLIINYLCGKIDREFDKGGLIARKGNINNELLAKLNKLTFYNKKAPKSLGKEWLVEHVFPLINNTDVEITDIIATYTEHCALQIGKSLSGTNKQKALFTGGGTKNKFLLERIAKYTNVEIIVPDEKVIDFKEAIIFAFLGVLRLLEMPNSLKTVTGAKKDSIGGAIYCG